MASSTRASALALQSFSSSNWVRAIALSRSTGRRNAQLVATAGYNAEQGRSLSARGGARRPIGKPTLSGLSQVQFAGNSILNKERR